MSANPSRATIAPGQKAAFALPAQYTYGNDGRNVLRAGNLVEVDMTREQEFRAQVGEVQHSEHPSFAAPTATINTGSGGQVSSAINSSCILHAGAKAFL